MDIDKFDVDLVYTWCDGSDPKFRNKKAVAAGTKISNHDELNGIHHIMQADELMYSLRSVQKNLKWINNIWIIVDEQVPSFINLNNPKIHIVDLKDIFPADAIPNFNTNAIETVMGRIKGLSEYFILASDDMFANKPLTKDYFFTSDRKPIIHVRKTTLGVKYWYALISYTCNAEITGKPNFKILQDFHNMTPHVKSDYNDIVENSKYKKVFEATIYSQFRSFFNIQRIFIYMLLEKVHKVVFKKQRTITAIVDQSYCTQPFAWIITLMSPNLFCINARRHQTKNEIKKIRKWLSKKFPEKSQFE